jgi:tetratricopeptide (TPR) repeat protein
METAEGTLKEGIRLYRLKKWEPALQELLRVKSDHFGNGERAELAYYLGLCCTKMGRYDDAIVYLEQVINLGQDMLRTCQCRMTLAYIYAITARAKMAEYELARLTSRGFESAQLYATLAYAAWSRKQHRRAVEFYEKALDLDPSSATALNGLGYVLADTGMDPRRALRYCRRAVDLRPQHPAYLDSLGWTYFKLGDLPEARTWLRRALDLDPEQREIKEHILAAEGRTR